MRKKIIAVFENLKFHNLLAAFLLAGMSHQVTAQGRCDLVSEECLDVSSSGSLTVTLPSNTTRLSTDGFSICLTPESSSSEDVDLFWLINQAHGMRDVDPWPNYLPTATKLSMTELHEKSPTSHGGALEFAGTYCNPQELTLMDDAGLTTMHNWVDNNLATKNSELGCSNGDAADSHVDWIGSLSFADSVLHGGSHDRKAIFFVTDGREKDSQAQKLGLATYDAWIDSLYNAGDSLLPVYILSIGDTVGRTDEDGVQRMINLATITNGGFYSIPAGDSDTLRVMMLEIINLIVRTSSPVHTTVQNTSLGQTSTADSTNHISLPGGGYQVILDSILGLVPDGSNEVVVTSISSINGVDIDTTVFNLTINTTDPPTGSLGDINLPDSLFDITCVEPSQLFATDGDNLNPVTIDSLNFESTVFGAMLVSISGLIDPDIYMEATLSGDNLTKTLTQTAIDSIYTGSVNFDIATAAANATVEGSLGDQIILTWWHPRDSADFARDTLYISNPTVETPQYTSTNGNPFKSFTEVILFTNTDDPVTIYYTTDGSNPTTSSTVYVPGSPIYVTDDIIIKAFATKTGYLPSGILTADIDRASTISKIQILSSDTLAFPGDLITTNETDYVVRLQTNYYENTTLNPLIQALGSGDSEALSMTIGDTLGSNGTYDRIYTKAGNVLALNTSASVGNGVLETNGFDTLIISWINPLNGSDNPRDTVYVQPVNTQAQIWFSTSSSIEDTTDSYSESASPVWMIVSDQAIHPESTYTATLTSGTGESESVSLSMQGGYLVGSINATYAALDAGSGFLDVNLAGNTLFANYTDPIYGDNASQDQATYPAKSVATPVADPVAGTYFINDTSITLSVTGGALIRYTTDGTDPTNPATASTAHYYTGPIPINSTITIRAVAYFQFDSLSNHIEGGLLTATYFLRDSVGNPFANPATTFFTTDTTVYLIPADTNDNIWYTTNGMEPDSTDGVNSTRYDFGNPGILLTDTTTLKFYSTSGYAVPSDTITEVYTLRATLVPPAITPGTTTFLTDTTVTITHPTPGTLIYYTTDGTDPDDSSPRYLGSFTVSTPTTVKAIAYNPPAYINSSISQADYYPLLTVTASPTGTSFTSSIIVSLTSNNDTAAIYYTLDGNDPDSSAGGSTVLYTGTPITITNSTTLKAIAVVPGWWTSDIIEEVYTRSSTVSTLKILDEFGVAFPGDVIMADVTKYSVRISTNYLGSNTLTFADTAWNSGDVETPSSTSFTLSANPARIFEDVYNMTAAGENDGDGLLQVSLTDTVVITWVNPFDPADIASDTVTIQPVDTTATAYFSTTSGGTAAANLGENTTPVFVVVEDQTASPGLTYQVVLTTATGESETLTLNTGGAKFTAQLPADYSAIVASDGTLQVNLGGEQITVTYVDPLYTTDTATGVVQYAGKSVADPEIIPTSGTFFTDDTTFTLTSDTAAASIRYTLDQTDPSDTDGTLWTAATDTLTTSTIIRAIAYISNGPGNVAYSNIVQFTLNKSGELGIPTADPPSTYYTEDTTVLLIPALLDSTNLLWYTTNGNDPDKDDQAGTGTVAYDYNGSGIAIDGSADTVVIKFYATKPTFTSSIIVSETYIKRDTLVAPTATPPTTSYSTSLDVALSHPVSGVQIRYTLNGGTPTTTSPLYSSTFNFTEPTVLRAIAFNPVGVDSWVQSPMITETYTPILTVAADPLSETFDFQDTIVLSSNNPTASIYYTLDGVTIPTAGSTLYTGAPIIVSSTTTIQAIAILTDWQSSTVLNETYTRNSSTSLLELLDSNGIDLPGDILKGDQNKYTVQISTNYGASTTLNASGSTLNAGDSEPLALTTITGASGTHARIFLDPFNFAVGSVTASDGTLQASGYDTIVVTWTNPLDSGDVVTDSLYVQPSDITSAIYLATGNQLSDTSSTFTENDNVLYVIVTDQEPHDDSSFTVTITTPTGDVETVTLTWQDSMFVGSIPVDYNNTDANGGTLQINLGGEQIQVTYTDPLYPADNSTETGVFGAKTIATPVLVSPEDSAWFHIDTTVTFSVSTSGALIRYVIGGGNPNFNTGTIGTNTTVNNDVSRVNAIAYLYHSDNNYVESPILETIFFKRGITRDPTAIPQGPYFTESIDVTLLSFDPLDPDVIYYTTDGSDPDTGSGILYTTPVTLTADTTELKFFAVNGTNMPSNIISFTYIKRDTLPPPTADPVDGTIFSGTLDVTLLHVTVPDARIYYTIDGTEPDSTSNLYTEALTFNVPVLVKAVAYGPLSGPDIWVHSVTAEFNYIPKVATPVADPPSGIFLTEIFAQLNVSTLGASIYYTLDGTTPDINSIPYSQIIRFSQTDTLKVVGTKPGWANSDVLTVIYTKEFVPSTLKILDGNQQEVDYLTEKNASVNILLEAVEADLLATDAVSITLIKADNETVTLLQSGRSGDFFKFIDEVPFSVTINGTTVSGVIDAQPFDTLVVTWHNPNNPADSASDRVPVIPFPTESDIYFTDETGGEERLSEYEGTEDTLYIVVRDQVWDPSLTYTVTLVTDPTFGENRIPDIITLPLVELDSGIYGVAIPVDKNPDADTDDDLLQLVNGDLILATYIDPVNPDTSTTQATYGGPGEVEARVFFTYDGGTEIPDGVFWDPSEEFLYVTYIDDYTEKPKELTIMVTNTTGTGTVTYDALVVDLGTPVKSDSVGTWRVAIPMDEVETPDENNGVVEVFFKGDVTASVHSHTREGTASAIVQDELTVANPNENETVMVGDTENLSEILRTTDSLTIILNEQDFTGEIDTLLVTVQCLESNDVVRDVILIQQEDGTYLGTIEHNETLPGVIEDGTLSCTANDEVRVIYIDPVYGTDDVVTRAITAPSSQTVEFVDAEGNIISNLDEYEGGEFKIVATAFSESTTEIDTLQVILTTSSGDQVTVTLIETGEFTGVFESDLIEYTFVYGDEVPGEGVLVVDSLNENSFTNSGTVTATLVTDQGTTSNNLEIESAFIPVDKVWIVDGYDDEFNETGSDGIADTIYVQFLTNLRELPEVINNINWPGDDPDNFTATYDPDNGITEISFYVDENGDIDSSIIVIVLKDADEVFDFGATSTGEDDNASLTLVNNNIFKGQTVNIEDRVSPVIVSAERLPSDLEHYEFVDDDGITRYRVNPDSIIITFSEELLVLTSYGVPWDSLVMFSATCNKDSGHFLITFEGQEPIELEPDSAGNPRWKFVITNEQGVYKPTGEGCVWLNPNAQYTDLAGNLPSNYDVEPEGLNNSRIIVDSYIFHPVVGVEDPDETGSVAGNMTYNQDGELVPVQQIYIPPFNLNSDGTTMSLKDIRNQCGEDPAPETEDFRKFEPNCLSAIFVESQVGYAAHIDIYDHLGKYIYTSTQYFGLCGELENDNRRGSDGFRNWLVWNTRDSEGNFVGSGVYIFRVRYLPLPNINGDDDDVIDGSILPLAIYKQGIARNEPPDINCSE